MAKHKQSEVLRWFNDLYGKDELSFLVCDEVEFYPSISEKIAQ